MSKILKYILCVHIFFSTQAAVVIGSNLILSDEEIDNICAVYDGMNRENVVAIYKLFVGLKMSGQISPMIPNNFENACKVMQEYRHAFGSSVDQESVKLRKELRAKMGKMWNVRYIKLNGDDAQARLIKIKEQLIKGLAKWSDFGDAFAIISGNVEYAQYCGQGIVNFAYYGSDSVAHENGLGKEDSLKNFAKNDIVIVDNCLYLIGEEVTDPKIIDETVMTELATEAVTANTNCLDLHFPILVEQSN